MNTNQIRMVRGMLSKAGLTPHKEAIVESHTDGRTTSLTDMRQDETMALIKYLEGQLKQPASPAEKMRNKILSIAHEMHWQNGKTKTGKPKVDMLRVDNWCVNKFKYTLDALPYLDLCRAVTAFEQVLVSYLKGI